MSQIIVNIPDCATQEATDSYDIITVNTENCPAAGVTETMFSTWQFILMAVIVLAFIGATAMVRYRRHERLETQYTAELEASVAKSTAKHINCPTCGDRYIPEKS